MCARYRRTEETRESSQEREEDQKREMAVLAAAVVGAGKQEQWVTQKGHTDKEINSALQ